ncbi:hypothetical protein GTN30_06390 [Macrococcoides canis]|uniref:Uncharacterized protein n=1 Tax=Macrococcoides canis TaxID=1855823 RepID=A0AAE7BZX1_9STAP|nr:hypothetical protein [Macrococcus canis]QIH78296.1 hypothetical protein GTN30_06390 [Macrococcus canis]
MTDKEKYEFKILSIIFLSILIIILVSIFIWIDVGRNNDDSATNIFLTGLNVMIMSVLTYLLLETTRKSNSINDKLVELSKMEFKEKQTRDLLDEIAIVERYIKIAEQIYIMTLRHVSIENKYEKLKKLFSKDIPIDRYMILNAVDKDKLPEESIFNKMLNSKDNDYEYEKNVINNLFNNSLHFKLHRKDLRDFNFCTIELKKLFEEPFLNYYQNIKKGILQHEVYIEMYTNEIITQNNEGDLSIAKLNIDVRTANDLSIHLTSIIYGLNKLKTDIENRIERVQSY